MDIDFLARKFYEHARYIRALSPKTIHGYRAFITFYCKTAGVERIEQITEENLREFFLRGRTERNWKANSFIRFYRTLSVFFNWCVKNNYMKRNPLTDIALPKAEKRLPTNLSKQEALRLLEVVYNYPYNNKYLRYRNHAIFSTFVFAGLRRSELLHLRLNDVDIENLTIFVNQGKGNKDRIIPMSFTLAESLIRYLDERKRLNKTCPEFFASSNRSMGFTDTGLKHLMEKIVPASKMKFTIHQLRHTFATLMLEGGCDIYSLSKMMGHSDIKTTTIYLAASAQHLRDQMYKHPLNTEMNRNS